MFKKSIIKRAHQSANESTRLKQCYHSTWAEVCIERIRILSFPAQEKECLSQFGILEKSHEP